MEGEWRGRTNATVASIYERCRCCGFCPDAESRLRCLQSSHCAGVSSLGRQGLWDEIKRAKMKNMGLNKEEQDGIA